MDQLKIEVILGSTRKNRFSEKPGTYIFGELAKREAVEAELIDLRDWPLPFYDEAGSPNALKGNFENELAKKWNAKIAEADAYIMVTPEYNHGYSAVLKNAIDWTYGANWAQKPVCFVSYGSAMGVRAIGQLRQVVIEAQLVPIRNSITLDWGTVTEINKHDSPVPADVFKTLREPVDKVAGLFEQLEWYARALKSARMKK